MRKILFYAALNVVRKGGILHETYRSYLERGMKKIKAITAISRKLVCIIYALVRDSSDYIEKYHNFEKAA
jgi:predicted cupin superfamily sugar epimerase